MEERQCKEFIEQLWVKAQIDVKKKQLDKTFAEYDKVMGIVKGPSKRWTNEEYKYLLMHPGEDHGTVGAALGRSYMSIKMQRDIDSDFAAWQLSEEGQQHGEKTREQQIDAFLHEEEANDG
jgi:hypothetical protein